METLFKNVLFSDGIGGVKMAEKTLKLNKNNLEWCLSTELLHTSTDGKILIRYHVEILDSWWIDFDNWFLSEGTQEVLKAKKSRKMTLMWQKRL